MNKGFTLTEVVISAAIFVIIWLALMGTIVIGKACESVVRHRIQAAYLTQKEIEYLRKQSFANIVNSTFANITIDTKGTNATADDLVGQKTVNVETSPSYGSYLYKKITVNIRWNQTLSSRSMKQETLRLSTYIANDAQAN